MSSASANASGTTVPIWYADAPTAHEPAEFQTQHADACVVGAGIAGLTTAYLLARAGRRVVVIDEKPVGGGESGRTSAHLASAIDDRFQHIERLHGQAACRLHYESHAAAINLIERIQHEEHVACDFARVNGYLFLDPGHAPEFLNEELAAAHRAGALDAARLERVPGVPGLPVPCLAFPRQGQFHPLKYLGGLADALRRMGVRVLSGQRVMNLSGDGPVVAKLQSGEELLADVGVAATNIPTPINNWVGIYTKQAPYRSYVIGFRIASDEVPDALYWDCADPYHYIRVHESNGEHVLLVGGEDHKTGQLDGDATAPLHHLESWTRTHFPSVGERVCAWSGQVNEPDDGVAFIGRVPTRGHRACYAITGDSGMGLTHGTLGAMLVSDLILGRSNPWESLYDPSRKPLKAMREFVRENANAAAQLADYIKPGDAQSIDAIAPGEGAIIRDKLKPLAVFRDAAGSVHKCSAICPHLKCIVRWNPLEKSWDCPCHGSRFNAEGRLIMGPAIDDLGREP